MLSSMVTAEPSPSTFVRGMMAADQQFGLYMALSETNRGGGDGGLSVNDVESSQSTSVGGVGPVLHVSRAVDQAREAAINFADTVRRRAFVPQPKRRRM
jgi:hypothetical protein